MRTMSSAGCRHLSCWPSALAPAPSFAFHCPPALSSCRIPFSVGFTNHQFQYATHCRKRARRTLARAEKQPCADVFDVCRQSAQGVALVFICGQLTGLTAVALSGDVATVSATDLAAASLLTQTGQLAGALWLLASTEFDPGASLGQTQRPSNILTSVGTGVIFGGLALLSVFIATSLASPGPAANTAEVAGVVEQLPRAGVTSLFLSTCVLGPASEEIVFRGIVLRGAMAVGMRPLPAAAVSTGAFLLLHPHVFDWVGLAPLSATLASAMLVPGGGLLSATVAHAMYNTVIFAAGLR